MKRDTVWPSGPDDRAYARPTDGQNGSKTLNFGRPPFVLSGRVRGNGE